jgi:hypothetical protein
MVHDRDPHRVTNPPPFPSSEGWCLATGFDGGVNTDQRLYAPSEEIAIFRHIIGSGAPYPPGFDRTDIAQKMADFSRFSDVPGRCRKNKWCQERTRKILLSHCNIT